MSNDLKNEIKKIRNEYIYKVFIRIIWPIFPIGMEIFIRVLLKMNILFPDKTILVIAFIIPALYLPDYKDRGEISLTLLSMCCLLSVVPFFCSIISQDIIIFWAGFLLLMAYIIIFLVFDYLSYKKDYSNLLGGRR